MGSRATLSLNRSYFNHMEPAPVEKPIKLGVVGLGHRSVYNVVNKVVRYDEYELAAVCDIRHELVEKVTSDLEREHGLKIPGYTNYDQMLKTEQMDAVAVQIDPDKQIPLVCQALEAGMHVMAEVPLAYSIDHCWQLVTTVERTGKIFLLMEQLRYAGYVRAWRKIVETGVIGKPVFAEGEYFHYVPEMFFQDSAGRFYTPEQAKKATDAKPTWRYLMPIIGYLPHDLSPVLYVLDDRVTRVVGMSNRKESYRFSGLKYPDTQAALMHTEKDVVMRMAVSFSIPSRYPHGGHWQHIKGTEGALEGPRNPQDKHKLWVEDWHLTEPFQIPWTYSRTDAPPEAAGSGHGDLDFYTFAQFADAVLYDVPLEFDVYKAVETAAPAILAATSIDQDNTPQDVPDFRPGPNRKPGEMPEKIK